VKLADREAVKREIYIKKALISSISAKNTRKMVADNSTKIRGI
jgi:hypothetical protein